MTATVMIRCFISCGILEHVNVTHGLDGVKVSPVIADLVAAEDDFSVRSIFVPNDDAPLPDEENGCRKWVRSWI